jgi:hypothetical protein
MKKLLIAGAILAVTASSAFAQGGGINLAFNDCGTFGAANAAFACNVNTGSNSLVASFVGPTGGLPEFLGISAQIDIRVEPALTDWWKHGTGQCRGTTGLATNFDFTSNSNCVDFYVGAAAGGFAYDVGFNGDPARARLRVQCAIPFDNRGPIDDVSEIYAFKANLLRAKTTGVGLCAGCTTPACIVFNEIQLFQPFELANDPIITTPLNSNFVTWQGGPGATCPASTPTQKSSWGQVKSLYR